MPEPDLFEPSLQDGASIRTKALPWRVGSQFWPAFFGGSLAVGALAWLNGKRLGLAPERQRWIAVATLVALVLSMGLVVWLLQAPGQRVWSRRAVQAVAVALYLVLARIQQPADRRHQMFGGKYASMWLPGFLALLGGTVALFLFVAAAVAVSMALQ